MKTTKVYYLDLKDLGTAVTIKEFEPMPCNQMEISGIVTLNVHSKKLLKALDLTEENNEIFLEVFSKVEESDGGVELFFVAEEGIVLSTNEDEYKYESFGQSNLFSVFRGDRDCALPQLQANRNLVRVLEAYATAQFFKKLDIEVSNFGFEMKDRSKLSANEDEHYCRKFLVLKNFRLFTRDDLVISGKLVNYPIRK